MSITEDNLTQARKLLANIRRDAVEVFRLLSPNPAHDDLEIKELRDTINRLAEEK